MMAWQKSISRNVDFPKDEFLGIDEIKRHLELYEL